jgi:hypothetical protein
MLSNPFDCILQLLNTILSNMTYSNRYRILLSILVMLNAVSVFAVGQSAVITLVFPSGSRTLAMGEVGTALADDEQVLFYNPAGLGMKNERWRGGAFTEFYEQLLPAFRLPDLWHLHFAGCYQPRTTNAGGFGLDLNYINFGRNDLINQQGQIVGSTNSYEYVLTGGWGFNFEDIGVQNHFFGIEAKFIYSALARGIMANTSYNGTTGNIPNPSDMFVGSGNGVGTSFALDVGYLWRFLPFMRFGFTFANMGPSVYYISQDQKDPVPFTINTAVAYKDDFCVKDKKVFELAAELRSDLEVVKNYQDKSPDPFWKAIYTGLLHDTSETTMEKFHEINWHVGFDATFLNTISVRQGFLIDVAGLRYETTWGLGLRLFNHFQWDLYGIISPEGYMKGVFGSEGSSGARHGQIGTTFTFYRMFSWGPQDRVWWNK